MSKVQGRYSFGFTIGSLMYQDADLIIENIADPDRFIALDEKINYGLLSSRSESSKIKIGVELKRRIKNFKNPYLIYIWKRLDKNNQRVLLFYASCLTYQLIADFMLQVVLKKWQNIDLGLSRQDFFSFLYKKSDQYPELMEISETTRKKGAQVILRMLNEVGILKERQLRKIDYDPKLLKAICQNGDEWFLDAILLNQKEKDNIINS